MVSTNCIKLYFTHSIVYLLFINNSFNSFLSQLKKKRLCLFHPSALSTSSPLVDGKHIWNLSLWEGENGHANDIKFYVVKVPYAHQESLFFFDNEKEKGRGKGGASHTRFCTKDTNMQSFCCVRWKTVFCCQQSFCGCFGQNVWKLVMSWGVDLGICVRWWGLEPCTLTENWQMQPSYHRSRW